MLRAEPAVREFRRTPFDFGALAGQPGQLLLPGGTRGGCACKLGGSKLAALGIGKRTLFRLDLRAQRYFGQPFDMRLLRCSGLGGSLGGRTPQCLLRRKFVGLYASLRRNNVFGSLQVARFGGSTGTFVRSGARQRLGFGSSFGIHPVSRGHAARRELAALSLQIHQSRQDFAQSRLPVQAKACDPCL